MPLPDAVRECSNVLVKHGYAAVRKIGEGAFGVAVLVEDKEGGKAVCKVVNIGRAGPKETREAKSEARLLSTLKHPYIVRYRESFTEQAAAGNGAWFCIVMDFCEGGDLTAQIEKAKAKAAKMPETRVLRWITQAILALKYLHDKHTLHRDLKPSNLFLTGTGDLRMGDFGIAKVLCDTLEFAKSFVGTPYYISPEVIQEKPYSWPADVWSMGCILYHLCALVVPFEAKNMSELSRKITMGAIPKLPAEYSETLRGLCSEMMQRKPEARASVDDLVSGQTVQDAVKALLAEKKEKTTAGAAGDKEGAALGGAGASNGKDSACGEPGRCNDEGAAVQLLGGEAGKLYCCGRRLAVESGKASDDTCLSFCGQEGAPQCPSCKRYQLLSEASGESPLVKSAKFQILEQFSRFDHNRDGVVERADLADVLKHLDGRFWTDERVDEALKAADANQDGKIHLDDFVQWIFGGGGEAGMIERAQQLMACTLEAVAAADLEALGASLASLRQVVDVGCLRVAEPALTLQCLSLLGRVATEAHDLLHGAEPADAYEVAKHLGAVAEAVAVLLTDAAWRCVARVGAVSSRTSLRGLVFEMMDGTRLGQAPAGLSDSALEACGTAWQGLREGEYIVEVRGHGLPCRLQPPEEAAAAAPQNARPSAVAGRDGRPGGRRFAGAGRSPSPAPARGAGDGVRGRSRSPSPGQGLEPIPERRRSPSPAPSAIAEDALASNVTLVTSLGRTLDFGGATGRGPAFCYKVDKHVQIEDVIFAERTCTGVRGLPLSIAWPRDKQEAIRQALHTAAEPVFRLLVSFCRLCEGEMMLLQATLLQARQLRVAEDCLTTREARQEAFKRRAAAVQPPGHWDVSAMAGATPEAWVAPGMAAGNVRLQDAQLETLQEMLYASFAAKPCSGRDVARCKPPTCLQLEWGLRLQNWRAWVDFAAREDVLRQSLRNKDLPEPGGRPSLKTSGFQPLALELDEETRCVWLFCPLSVKVASAVVAGDLSAAVAFSAASSSRSYGHGAYLYDNCRAADELAAESESGGLRCLLLCRAMLGRSLRSDALLPDLAQLHTAYRAGEHHSILGERDSRWPEQFHKEFVFYDPGQVYPEFLLWYRRLYS
eukprot:TRINITY_DN7625_c0_g1_i1.p1 TRINITY_DN7625_c0_g1~~TRINITY_DN7625_c0_g1_i1.p1  ORF type:complete len:1111 (-),score=315.09 TRINITY_DN7625_c0_g1_i1:211-3543(-)